MSMEVEIPLSPVVPQAPDDYKGPFNAIGRLFHACSTGWPGLEGAPAFQCGTFARGSRRRSKFELSDLADGPYFTIVEMIGADDLSRCDSVCRLTRELNRSDGGPWWALGRRDFAGLELDGDTTFDPREAEELDSDEEGSSTVRENRRKMSRVDWKSRYLCFQREVKMFRNPFTGSEIRLVEQADEIAYCRPKLRTDLLSAESTTGIYLEIEVQANPDNVSLAVVDFEAGGCSSVTFSPDTGAVIRERKVREVPRKVEGTYIQPLTTITAGQGFEGSVGLFLQNGKLAFFRKHSVRRVGLDKASDEQAAEEQQMQLPPVASSAGGGSGNNSNSYGDGNSSSNGSSASGSPGIGANGSNGDDAGSGSSANNINSNDSSNSNNANVPLDPPSVVKAGTWESTGFVTDLSWAEGRRLTPCLAFRDVGHYHLYTTKVDSAPPIKMNPQKLDYDDSMWRSLDWDAGEQEEEGEGEEDQDVFEVYGPDEMSDRANDA